MDGLYGMGIKSQYNIKKKATVYLHFFQIQSKLARGWWLKRANCDPEATEMKSQSGSPIPGVERCDQDSGMEALQVPVKGDSENLHATKHSSIQSKMWCCQAQCFFKITNLA